MSDPVVPDDSAVPDHRPAPDSAKLAGQFAEWIRGETLVGRMLANLKTGRLPEVLAAAALAAEDDGPRAELVAALFVHWNGWERGSIVPLEVAEGLRDAGLEAFLTDLIEG